MLVNSLLSTDTLTIGNYDVNTSTAMSISCLDIARKYNLDMMLQSYTLQAEFEQALKVQ